MDEQPAVTREMVAVEFSLSIGEGNLKATAVVPAGQTNLTQILPVLHSLEDSIIAGVAAQLGEVGRTVSCSTGCAACCRQLVPISIFEAEALTEWIQSLPESRQEEFRRRFHAALRRLADAGFIDRMVNEDWLGETETARQLALEYLYLRLPCPFLEDELCSIYSIRPMACREYLVTSPPEHCYDPVTLKSEPVPLPLHFSHGLSRIGAELENDSRGWIPLLFLFAWMKAGAHPGARVSGEGPQVLYEFVKSLSNAGPQA
jgi:Fe-S-cluster containining protein